MKGITHCLTDEEVMALAEMAHGHVGGDLKAVCLEGLEGNRGVAVRSPLSIGLYTTPLGVVTHLVTVCN